MEVTIRRAKKDDYDAVESIMKQVQQLHINWRPDIYKTIDVVLPFEEYVQAIADDTFFVAEMNQIIVGILRIMYRHICSEHQVTRDIIFIDTMAVEKDFKGKGVGHQFFDYLKNLKIEKNMDGIELQVNAKNVDAMKMYEKCGFTFKSINMELVN